MTKALALTTLALAVLPASAQAAEATFKVSLYGIQRYEKLSHEEQDPETDTTCFDARGDVTETTTVKFHTRKPVRMRVSAYGRNLSFSTLGKQPALYPLMVDADWTHEGSTHRETKSCTKDGDGWEIDPPPLGGPACSAKVDWMGFGLGAPSQGKGNIEASGGEGYVRPLGADPFDGCPYGDRSMTFYAARGAIKPSLLLQGRETEVVLRGREPYEDLGADGDFVRSTEKTTVYVTFKKVG